MTRALFALMGLAFGLVLAPLAAGQTPPRNFLADPFTGAFRQGTQGFRRIVERVGFSEVVTQIVDLTRDPENTLLIVLGTTAVLDQLPNGLGEFLERGGALLLATDRANQDAWPQLLGVRVSGQFVRGRDEAEQTYWGHPFCPRVVSATPESDHLFDGVATLASNRPSYLEYQGRSRLTRRAEFVRGCTTEADTTRPLDPHREFFAAWGPFRQGRVLVMADHSVFINDMLLRESNDNIRFAANCLAWLRAHDDRTAPRTRVLFVEEGTVRTELHEALTPPIPPPEALVPLLNHALRSLEEEDAFNTLLKNVLPPNRILLGVLALLTLLLVGYSFVWVGRRRHRTDREAPGFATLLARQATSAAVVELRHQAMLEGGNLWEAARALARQCFDEVATGGAAEMSQLAAEWGEPPRVHVSGGWWQRWQLGAQVRRLWQLAYDPVPVPVAPHEFAQLASQTRIVRAALAAGTVRIEPP